MRKILVIVLCTIFVCARSDCDDLECVDKVIKEILEEEAAEDVVNLKFEVPEFKKINNIEIKDVNNIILGLTKWFERKLNDSTIVYKSVNNNTKIFIKSFDFNIDFEHENARIDMGLAKETEDKKNKVESSSQANVINSEITSTTLDPQTEMDNVSNLISDSIAYNIKGIINKNDIIRKNNNIYSTIDFDTTYYDQNEDNNSSDYPIIDYIDIYKDTTNEEYLYTGTELPTTLASFAVKSESEEVSFESLLNDTTAFTNTVFPWVATIFIKNSTENSQFHYYCDGALLSEKVILTGGRCVYLTNGIVAPENVLVFLGKTNLQTMGGSEKLHRVKTIVLHHNFTVDFVGRAVNDLALLIMDAAAEFNDRIQSACIHTDETSELQDAATTAWGPNGQLLPIFFEKRKSDICFDKNEDIFCATYGNNVTLCPNYGGIYVTRRMSRWCLQGVFYGDPSYRGLCFNKNVLFTSLRNYQDWIDDYIVINANIL